MYVCFVFPESRHSGVAVRPPGKPGGDEPAHWHSRRPVWASEKVYNQPFCLLSFNFETLSLNFLASDFWQFSGLDLTFLTVLLGSNIMYKITLHILQHITHCKQIWFYFTHVFYCKLCFKT